MGHQIVAGDKGVFFTRGAWQVVHWCEKFSPPSKPENMTDRDWFEETCGRTNIVSQSVIKANSVVPHSFDDAILAGLIDKGVSTEEFLECRQFLAYAAANNLSIEGSY